MSVYVCSDIHGNMAVYKALCKFVKPTDTMYFLGDAADRGFDGWEIIKDILNRDNWIYIKGNHEDLASKGLRAYLQNPDPGEFWSFTCNHNFSCWMQNGGKMTFDAASREPVDELRALIHQIDTLPVKEVYTNANNQTIILTHAGYTPNRTPTRQDMIWSRDHFTDAWPEDKETTFIIHGHTPTCFMPEYIDVDEDFTELRCCRYADGHKFDIDIGATWNGKACVLNLDTFEEIIVEADND